MANIAGATEHQVIQDRNRDEPSGFGQHPGVLQICLAGAWIARRMVVADDDRFRPRHDRRPKHLARRGQRPIERSDTRDMHTQEPVLGVKQEDAERLAVVIADERAKHGDSVLWAADPTDRGLHAALADERHANLGNAVHDRDLLGAWDPKRPTVGMHPSGYPTATLSGRASGVGCVRSSIKTGVIWSRTPERCCKQ